MSDHLATCPDCRAEAVEWKGILGHINQALLRPSEGPCIDENDLAEYVDGVLGGLQRIQIEHHLAGCRICVRNLIALYDLVNIAAPDSKPHSFSVEWVRGKLALVQGSLSEMIQVRLTPLAALRDAREEPKAVCCSAQCNDGHLNVTLQRHETGLYSCTVSRVSEGPPTEPAALSLYMDESLIESQTLSNASSMIFANLEPGAYVLRLESAHGTTDVAFSIHDEARSR